MDYQAKDFGKLLKNNALTMRRLFQSTDTNCMRVYDRNMEEFPVTVDLWAQWVRITDYSEEGLDDRKRDLVMDLAGRMLYVPIEKVVYHHRRKRTGREQHDVQEPVSTLVEVMEQGLVFTVDLTKRVDTGLFLDHMPTRALVGSMSYGLRVLNLFSYTGSFSVYAARGGAVQVDSVDLSATYTAWAEANLAANGFFGPTYRCINADAFEYVKDALDEKRIYDLIIFDPPSFSNSRKMEHDFDIVRDYVRWLHALSALLKKGGTIIVSSSLGGFSLDKSALGGYTIEERTQDLLAPGFTRRSGTARTWVLTKERNHTIPAIFRNSRKNTETAHNEAQMDEEEMSKEEEKNKPEVKEATRSEEIMDQAFLSEEEDDVWTLVWDDEPEQKAEVKKERARRSESRRSSSSDRSRRDDSRPRRFDDRPRREYDDRPRRYDDRPRRDYDDRPRRYDDRPRREYDDHPRRYDDRPRREYDDDRPRRYDDRPRREYDDRPRRYDDRPRREYDDRPRRYDDRPRREYDDHPRRYDDRQRRGYDDGDNQRRAERAFEDRPKRDERPRRERKAPPKPYGFGAKAPRKAKREE